MLRSHRSSILSLVLLFSAASSLVEPALARQPNIPPPPSNPYLDPKDDPYNPLRYIASNTFTAIAFSIVLAIAFIQTWYTWKYRVKWMSAMVIGEYTYAIGFACRFGLHYHPESSGTYIVEYLFIVLSPCAFIAANYVLLGRLATHINCTHHVLLPVRRLTWIFVTSDITTFLIQAAGGGLSTSHDVSSALAGSHIFLAGLVLQLASFLVFSVIYARFLYKVCSQDPELLRRDASGRWYRDWRTLAGALVVSCIGILVRSGYRVAELSQGYIGHLATTEAFFYGLDTLPLLIAIGIYVPFWPGMFISPDATFLPKEAEREVEQKFPHGASVV
ncbi:RTA1-domain-containing protein [Coniophora puteana RWD-64-598 SS2]|uniref:RTA1-domain-containing protein n=1 Tax=Coniophora puteana (strain RWD-64-598) TaxID=741705 RepID=A0A5M3MSQ7_CONPW|nr:RTA1-domain-containing protein [Coniophora puteana RWD-64-598 SS2]EIW82130.1 RTA1-domain-containing protein [Coniophora puteana RWD-64-598 SS2]